MNNLFVFNPRPPVVTAAREQGFRVTALLDGEPDAPTKVVADASIRFDDLDHGLDIARSLCSAPDSMCVGFGDDTSELACMVNLTLGWRNLTSFGCLETFRNKVALRHSLGVDDRLNPHFTVLRRPFDNATEAIERIGFPLIVKPLASSGSRGIHAFPHEVGVHEIVAACERAGGVAVVEQFVQGSEVSVETFSWSGHHEMLGVTEKCTSGPPHFVEQGHVFPAPLPADRTDALRDEVTRILDAAGFSCGLGHTEFLLAEGGIRLVESHGRPGGDRISDLVRLSLGVSPFSLFFRALREGSAPTIPHGARHAASQFLRLDGLRVALDDWRREITGLPGVSDVEMLLPPERWGHVMKSADRHACVVVAAASDEELRQRIALVHGTNRTMREGNHE